MVYCAICSEFTWALVGLCASRMNLNCLPLVFFLLHSASSSNGDRSYVYYSCTNRCLSFMCDASLHTDAEWNEIYNPRLGIFEDLLRWQCDRECSYRCMWKTVDAFSHDGLPVPQFHGKWPFLRIFGVQEPASTLFSFVNLSAQAVVLLQLFSKRDGKSSMLKYWIMQYLFSLNAWIWSTIFHACDTPFTEKMDYFSAVAFIVASIAVLQRRAFPNGTILHTLCLFILVAFFAKHIFYLSFRNFDYGYNTMFAVSFGFINCLGWLTWSFSSRHHKSRRHIAYCRLSVMWLLISLPLELYDFPPIGWILDAHALWHASSLLVIVAWHKFVLGDCSFMAERIKAIA